MRKILLGLVLLVAIGVGVNGIFNTIKNEPATGMVVKDTVVVVVKPTPLEVVVEEVVKEVPEVMETPTNTFVPVKWNGRSIKKFAKVNGGVVIDVSTDPRAKELGGKKGVRIGSAIYFKGNKKNVYVYYAGEITKIN